MASGHPAEALTQVPDPEPPQDAAGQRQADGAFPQKRGADGELDRGE
jgi:hypothetical protein